MENARLITETREALEQQTATAEVLQVINSSPGDLRRCSTRCWKRRRRLCGADYRRIHTFDGEHYRLSPVRRGPADAARLDPTATAAPARPRQPTARRSLRERRSSTSPTIAADPTRYARSEPSLVDRAAFARSRAAAARTTPARRISVYPPGGPAVHRQADRPIGELRRPGGDRDGERAAVQRIARAHRRPRGIARIPDRDQRRAEGHQPLDLRSATGVRHPPGEPPRGCATPNGDIFSRDGEAFGWRRTRCGLARVDRASRERVWIPRTAARCRRRAGAPHVHILDLPPTRNTLYAVRRCAVGGIRTCSACRCCARASCRRHHSRAPRVEPFTERQIELVRTFAAQAVIAMENARLITETREALEQQTATAEVLQVINSSPGDSRRCSMRYWKRRTRLCGAAIGILATVRRRDVRAVAHRGIPTPLANWLATAFPPRPTTRAARILAASASSISRTLRTRRLTDRRAECAERCRDRRCSHAPDACRCARTTRCSASFTLPPGSAAILRQADRAVAEFRGAGGDRDGECAAARRNPPAPGRVAGHLRQHGRWRGDVRRELRLAAWNRNFQELLDLPDALLAERPSYRRLSPLSSPNVANSAPSTSRPNSAAASKTPTRNCASSEPPGWPGHRGPPQPGAGRRLRPDLQRHHRAQALRGRDPRRARCRRSHPIAT